MSALKDSVIEDTLDKVSVRYLDRETSKWWNARRQDEDVAVFCGYYWICGSDEAGPFRTRSSAIRDAYYRFVALRELPSVADAIERPQVPVTKRKIPGMKLKPKGKVR